MKLNQLTAEQEALLPVWRDKWIANGLSTEPCDFDKAEEAGRKLYRLCGLDEPKVVLRMGSPYGAVLGGIMAHQHLPGQQVQQVGQVEQQVGQQVWQQVGQQVWQQVGEQVWQVGQQVQQVGQRVGRQVWRQVGQQVWQQVGQQVDIQGVMRQHGLSLTDWRGCNLWSGWYSYASFFLEIGALEQTPAVAAFQQDLVLAQQCGLVWFSRDVLALSDKPRILRRDDNGALHCENGPALEYSDGWALHRWHGTVLPARWVEERHTIDPQEILAERDVEKRTAGIACIGYERVFDKFGRVIHDSGSDEIGQLVELALPDLPEPGRFLRALCPRNGKIFEGVPTTPEINTAYAAQAWREGLTTDEWAPPPVRT